MATFVTSDGIEIRYEVLGTGPPVAICHGGPNNVSDTLMRDLVSLTDSYALIFHDYRGSGGSTVAPVATYRFDRMGDDLHELREHLGHESMSVVAHSMGGFVTSVDSVTGDARVFFCNREFGNLWHGGFEVGTGWCLGGGCGGCGGCACACNAASPSSLPMSARSFWYAGVS